MDPRQWRRLKRAFSVVVARGAEDVDDGLPDACHGDAALQRALGHLIDEHVRLEHAGGVTSSTPSSDTHPRAFMGGRFSVLARVGAGTFGDVYRVVDQKSGTECALKVLRSADPEALQHFKQEFRRLADVHHPNIVTLHEFFADRDRWMFSMEFVEGVDFHRFLTSKPIADRDPALRSCLAQLAEGVAALHQQHLLHRDLKPSNVLVTADGGVKLLDFGLVRAFGQDVERSMTFAGTPDYMSPEQVAGEELRESSDWYGLGVMLYQALAGELPFRAGFLEVLRRKQFEHPVPPIDIVPESPADLSDLCVKLLQRDPSTRASYADVIRTVRPTESLRVRESPGRLFVGRHQLLQRLGQAYALAEDRPVLVHLCGPSGIGKTVLLREFLDRLGEDSPALIVEGRCYEGESVPYQAVDDLIDHVARYLRRLPRERVDQLLPRNFAVLARVFPVLARFLTGPAKPLGNLDSVELRSRAFVALREMFGRLSERHRVVLVIDDLQWGDEEGCAALNELVSSNDSPPMLVVAAYRSENVDARCLHELRETAGTSLRRDTIFLDLDSLSTEEAEELAASLLSRPVNPDALQRVVDQSAMSPFLVHEIVRWINARGIDRALAEPFSLDDVIRTRMGELGDESRRFLELAAVAGQPTKASILQAAGGITNVLAGREELVALRFIRSVTVDGEDVEVYHDRIRTAILADMDADRLARRHGELARALEADGAEDPERMAAHFEQAHEGRACAWYAWQAARRAVRVLAFNKASRFFELALSMPLLEPGARRLVHREFADALANAGRGPEAADHYIAACAGAAVDEQLELKQLAGEQLLYSGHVDRGLAMFETVLSQVGMKLPKPTSRMPLDLLIRRARLRIRGLRWHEREATSVPREMLVKVDTCASVATGLALVDIARGAALQTTSLILALQAGEPSRIARALAMEAGYRSTAGARTEARVGSLLSVARQLSDRSRDSRAIGLTAVMTAACAWSAGRWEECYRTARAAREALRDRFERVTWERDTASIFEVDGLRWMGRWAVMKTILPELLDDARARGDLYAQSILQMHAGSCAQLANDNPEGALTGLQILDKWANTGFHVEHLVETHNQVEIALYRGDAAEALARIVERWPALKSSLLLQVQTLDIQMRSLRARAALAVAAGEHAESARRPLVNLARRDSRAIRRERAVWGDAVAELIEGAIESLTGRREAALAAFGRGEAAAAAAGMILHAAVARRSQALLIGGDGGRRLQAAAETELIGEGIARPERLAAVIAPGLVATS